MNIDKLTQSEQFELLDKLNKSLGYYPILVLSIEDVRAHLLDVTLDDVSDDALHQACAYVACKYDTSHDAIESIHWASEVCLSIETN